MFVLDVVHWLHQHRNRVMVDGESVGHVKMVSTRYRYATAILPVLRLCDVLKCFRENIPCIWFLRNFCVYVCA